MADFADLMKAEKAKKAEQKQTPPRIIEQNYPAHPSETQPIEKKQSIDTTQASEKASIHASKHASTLALDADLETIRRTLKLIGKEVLYVRLTPEEKAQVGDIEYTYQRQGIKTSGNEIGRIALNFLLADYQTKGEQSILAKMLAALHT